MDLIPEQVLLVAEQSFAPVKRVVLFSGGNDSTTLLHWAWNHSPVQIDAAAHINTGIGVEQTRNFVRKFCTDRSISLLEQRAPDGEYERLCGEYGMPGPGMHWQMYRYLKDRQVEALVNSLSPMGPKRKTRPPVMLITGVRRSESQRRMGTTKPIKIRPNVAQLWVAPLIDWTRERLDAYRETNNVPRNEVADVMHMSMECACGAYGSPGERAMIRSFYPALDQQIRRCESIARDAGQKYTTWGERRKRVKPLTQKQLDRMEACQNCTIKEIV